MPLKKAARSSLVDQVVSQLGSLIESGQWPLGEKIPPEPELVEQLGVSRNTVREAVRALIYTGMLEARQGDGTYVRAQTDFGAAMERRLQKSNVLETMEVRSCLEREAARLASLRRTREDIQDLRDSLAKRDEIFEKSDNLEEQVKADIEFHNAVVAASHNSVLIDLYKYMSKTIQTSISSTMYGDAKLCEQNNQAHHKLVEAIINQDPAASVEAVRTHIETASQVALQKEQKEGQI
ncbi:DNA-binding FadR family transcriptional regulator [Scopulibacillus daqui]|uniref:DNA-binding FadR family transcriptional regulator n=1 Tax=Scopulibacillus daqui TaxID=1469162 RepID=A0ABS2PVE1_9BACL|nr:FadR/GntR family transcriptional regulator [Scopulibacillus daqui]MBM7643928.1 DNA-binding FadR family transcriptional regulator [Scopulibacillus daqui]